VCLNIAEAAGRQGAADKARVYAIARGEACEAAAALDIGAAGGDCSVQSAQAAGALARRLYALLNGLIQTWAVRLLFARADATVCQSWLTRLRWCTLKRLTGGGTFPDSHLIVVFGAALDECGRPGVPLARRLRLVLAEATADPEALVIVSGGAVRGRPAEAPVMRDWLVAEGVDASRILVEPDARSTSENARYCAALVARHPGVRRVTLVTERFHVLRSRVLLARALAERGLRVEMLTRGAPDHLGAFQWITRWLRELLKLARDARPWRAP
jgi:uncharacterized SAM-binding protein YcdF (DUF218 family)